MDDETQPLFSLDDGTMTLIEEASAASRFGGHGEHLFGPPMVIVAEPPSGEVSELVERRYIEPVRKLNATINDVLDVDAHPDRDPAEALALLKTAMDTFHEESATWLD